MSDIGPGGLGHFRAEQLAWLKKDLAGRSKEAVAAFVQAWHGSA